MSRLLGIDYGRKRCGLAVTDTMRIVASPLATVPTHELTSYVAAYASREPLAAIVVGLPRTVMNQDSDSMAGVRQMTASLRKRLPDIPIEMWDERFTSVLAHRSMIDGGLGRNARRDKALVDRTAATIILNDFLSSRRYSELFGDTD